MTRKDFLPPDFSPPTEITTPDFVLVPLAPEHNEIDFDAWSTSKMELSGIFGPANPWPNDVDGLAGNLKDLENHFAGFQARTEATYTVLSPDRKRCLGCVYLRRSRTIDYDVRVDYWIRTSDRARLEALFGAFIKTWLATKWPFKKPVFPGRELSWDEWTKACAERHS